PLAFDGGDVARALDDEVDGDDVQARVAAAIIGDAADQHLEVLLHHALHDVLIERLVAAAFGRVAEVGDVAELVLAVLAHFLDAARVLLRHGRIDLHRDLDALHEGVLFVVHDLLLHDDALVTFVIPKNRAAAAPG